MSELSKQQCFHNTYGATKSWSCSYRALVLFLCPSGRTNHNTNIKHGVEPSDHNKTSAKSYDVAHFVSKLAGAVQKPPPSSLHPAQMNHTVRTANKNLGRATCLLDTIRNNHGPERNHLGMACTEYRHSLKKLKLQ